MGDTDEDKIRIQMRLDVDQYVKQVNLMKLDRVKDELSLLLQLVTEQD